MTMNIARMKIMPTTTPEENGARPATQNRRDE